MMSGGVLKHVSQMKEYSRYYRTLQGVTESFIERSPCRLLGCPHTKQGNSMTRERGVTRGYRGKEVAREIFLSSS